MSTLYADEGHAVRVHGPHPGLGRCPRRRTWHWLLRTGRDGRDGRDGRPADLATSPLFSARHALGGLLSLAAPHVAALTGSTQGEHGHRAVVLSMDEKTSIQALNRTQPPLPLRTGRASRHTHDYKRNGVVDLYAALEVATGKVTHRITDSHTAIDFLAFMKNVARAYPGRESHVIMDNSSSHRTPDIQAWLTKNPRIHFHYTPTSASWLNQVEGFFGILANSL